MASSFARALALGFFLGVGEDLRGALVGLIEGRGGARVSLGDTRLGGRIGAPQDGVRVGNDGIGGHKILGQSLAGLVKQVEDLGLVHHD